MKKLLIAVAAVLVSVASYAQGTVAFNTRVPGLLDAPVTLGAGGPGPGPTYSAELGVVGANGTFTPIPGSVTTFRAATATSQETMKYVVTIGEVAVPGVPAAGTANLAFRAWLTSAGSYDAATALQRGISGPVSVTLGGQVNPTAPALPAANMVGLQGFVIPIPEPSTIALGALGAAALLLRRRK